MRLVSDKIARLSGRWWAMIVAAFALGVSSLFGGLQPAAGVGAPTSVVGKKLTGAPWNVTIESARVLSDHQVPTKKHGDHWVFVIATVEVTSDETRSDLADVLRLSGVPGIADTARPARTVLIRDNQDAGFLNPGMPERIAFGWEQAASIPIPTSVVVEVYNLTLRPDTLTGNSEDGELRWTDPAVVATVTVSVQDKRS